MIRTTFKLIQFYFEVYSRMNKKITFVLAIAIFGFSYAEEADWEVLNLAIKNPADANPQILSNSILNILKSFGPSTSVPTAATSITSTSPPTTSTPRPCPVCSHSSAPVIISASPQPQISHASPVPVAPSTPQITFHPIYLSAPSSPVLPQLHSPKNYYPSPNSHPQQQIIYSHRPEKLSKPSACGPHENSLADFLVNVPCPTTTTTQKPIRQIVVKVPCPTTTPKPVCECKCCPCNPCPTLKPKPSKPSKIATKCPEKESSEESREESVETKTIYKSYDPVMKKYVNAKRSYHSSILNGRHQTPVDYLWK